MGASAASSCHHDDKACSPLFPGSSPLYCHCRRGTREAWWWGRQRRKAWRLGGSGGGSYGGSHGGYNGGSNNWCLSTCGCSGTAATTTTTTAFPPRVGGSRILGGLADRFWGWGGWGGSSWGNWESDWCNMKCGCSGTATTTTTTTVSTFPPRNGA